MSLGTLEYKRGSWEPREPASFLLQIADGAGNEKPDGDHCGPRLKTHGQLGAVTEGHGVGRTKCRRVGQREIEVVDERGLPVGCQLPSFVGVLCEEEVGRLGEIRLRPRNWTAPIELPVDEREREDDCGPEDESRSQ